MVRLNITLPEDIAECLAKKKNKSHYIAEALREKFDCEKREKIQNLLIEGYKKANQRNQKLKREWDNEGIKEWK